MQQNAFLYTVAKYLNNKHGHEFENMAIVFPSKRSILYFQKHIINLIKSPTWSPKCFTISDFYKQFAPQLHIADELILISYLYSIYTKVIQSQEDFDTFYYWGKIILSDFDEIDKFKISAEKLFSNISDLKDIDKEFEYLTPEQFEIIKSFWGNIIQSKDSDDIKLFKNTWSKLYTIYSLFNELLINNKFAYEGMLHRQVASLFDNDLISDNFSYVSFVGLNALTECDKSILRYYQRHQKALFFWDYHPLFIENTIHEAGYFMRENLKEFSSAIEFSNSTFSSKISIHAIASNIGQAIAVNELISQTFQHNISNNSTAIVLADESLLLPLLHSLPENLTDVNVTMGYSLQNTHVFSFVNILKNIIDSVQTESIIPYTIVKQLLTHPYAIYLSDQSTIETILKNIIQKNYSYVPFQCIHEYDIQWINKLLASLFNFHDFIVNLLSILHDLLNFMIPEEGEDEIKNFNDEFELNIELQAILSACEVINKLHIIIQQNKISISSSTGIQLLIKHLKSTKIPFETEPLIGIQIMGFLETRALDFDNVIILSANEGHLPPNSFPISFIPLNLRRAHGMPAIKYHDSIYAYNFYRLLMRAKNVDIFYSTASTGITYKEMSHYIRQIIFSSNFDKKLIHQGYLLKEIHIGEIIIPKKNEILNKLNELISSILYPSAIVEYIKCTLRFYFRYIEKLKPVDNLQQAFDSQIIGTILHNSMQLLYAPFLNSKISIECLNQFLEEEEKYINPHIYKAIAHYFTNYTSDNNFEKNQNPEITIVFEIIKKYIKLILDYDKELILNNEFKILALEKNIKHSLQIENQYVNIGGRIDRVDMLNKSIRIVDYKTGNIQTRFKNIETLFERENRDFNHEALQILIYAWLYHKKFQQYQVYPVIYSLRNINKNNNTTFFACEINSQFASTSSTNKKEKHVLDDISYVSEEIENQLKNLFVEMLNPSIPFVQTKEKVHCQYCNYKDICMR